MIEEKIAELEYGWSIGTIKIPMDILLKGYQEEANWKAQQICQLFKPDRPELREKIAVVCARQNGLDFYKTADQAYYLETADQILALIPAPVVPPNPSPPLDS